MRVLLATALGLVGLSAAAVAASSASAVAAGRTAGRNPAHAATKVTARLLPFGCANPANHRSRRLLPAARVLGANRVRCFGAVYDGTGAAAANSTAPSGFSPTQIRAAYGLNGTTSNHQTVALIDAYDDPHAEADLKQYRAQFHLPPCTTANHCFRKVNAKGKTSPLPTRDPGWSQEISLDLDAVSATCPDCRILLIEATSDSPAPLDAAVDRAVTMGARFISNSYGGPEDSSILREDKHFNHHGIAMVAAAGDSGFGVAYPASSRYVTAVGGTHLAKASNKRGWVETAWGGSGSGCSRYEQKPAWQHDGACKRRTMNDTAADGAPVTGIAMYDTYNNCGSVTVAKCQQMLRDGDAQGQAGWSRIGGTSLAAPIVTSIYALARHGVHYGSRIYSHRNWLNDVVKGSNGACGGRYLCHAKKWYDGPTGFGTPWGRDAF